MYLSEEWVGGFCRSSWWNSSCSVKRIKMCNHMKTSKGKIIKEKLNTILHIYISCLVLAVITAFMD